MRKIKFMEKTVSKTLGCFLRVFLISVMAAMGHAQERHFRDYSSDGVHAVIVDHYRLGEEIMNVILSDQWAYFDGNDKLLFRLSHKNIPGGVLNFWVIPAPNPPGDRDSAAKIYRAEIETFDAPRAITGFRRADVAPAESTFPLVFFLAPSAQEETQRAAVFFIHAQSLFCCDITFGDKFTYELRKNFNDLLSSISFKKQSPSSAPTGSLPSQTNSAPVEAPLPAKN